MVTTATSEQRFLDPKILARLSNLQLVAKTVVEGFLIGLHRSPYFGVSIDFAEYRPYSPGDDLRSVDWNVFARTDRYYLKKYHGDTNAEVHIVVDASASMGYRSGRSQAGTGNGKTETLTKFEYGCFLAASLAYFAIHQRDSVGLLLFDTEVQERIPARTRRGQLSRILHALDRARPGKQTDFAGPLRNIGGLLRRRGLVILISDFYDEPQRIMTAVKALRFAGNDVVLFHLMDPGEMELQIDAPTLLEDLETGERVEVVPEYAAQQYRRLIEAHIAALRHECDSAHLEYEMINTGRPLDYALFAYLSARQRRM